MSEKGFTKESEHVWPGTSEMIACRRAEWNAMREFIHKIANEDFRGSSATHRYEAVNLIKTWNL